jgi:transposase
MAKTEASRVFNISRNTIYLWLKRHALSGSYKALPNRPPGNNHKILCWDTFCEFVEIHGDKTQAEMAQLWPEDISQRTISRALAKIGFTRKKTFGYQERDPQKRAEFLSEISDIAPEDIVYADESGMDERDQYEYGYNECGKRFHALKTGKRQNRINMVAALCNGQLLAPFTLEGPTKIPEPSTTVGIMIAVGVGYFNKRKNLVQQR